MSISIRDISRVQSELTENGNGTAQFTVDRITVFLVSVNNSPSNIVTPGNQETNQGNQETNQESNQGNNKEILDSLTTKSLQILRACANEMHSKEELFSAIGMTAQTNNVRKHLTPLIAAGLLTYEDPSTPTKRGQRYCITERGILALNILNVT